MAAKKHIKLSDDDVLIALQERLVAYEASWRAFDDAAESAPDGSLARTLFGHQRDRHVDFLQILSEAMLAIPASGVTGALIQLRAMEYVKSKVDASELNQSECGHIDMLLRAGFESIGMALESTLSPEQRKRLGFKPFSTWLTTSHSTDVFLFCKGLEIDAGLNAFAEPLNPAEAA